ncbi:hypothetical protein MTO96_031910 [Rhipicephalus appendiculatus]
MRVAALTDHHYRALRVGCVCCGVPCVAIRHNSGVPCRDTKESTRVSARTSVTTVAKLSRGRKAGTCMSASTPARDVSSATFAPRILYRSTTFYVTCKFTKGGSLFTRVFEPKLKDERPKKCDIFC